MLHEERKKLPCKGLRQAEIADTAFRQRYAMLLDVSEKFGIDGRFGTITHRGSAQC